MGTTYTYKHAAALAAHLPNGSALRKAIDPSQEWSQTDYLLCAIEYDLRRMQYTGKGPRPKPLKTPADNIEKTKPRVSHAEMRWVAESLGIPEERR